MDIDVFILIGGRSSRLGTNKAFAEFGGETLASRSARIIESGLAPAHITFVTAADGQFDAQLILDLDAPVIVDLNPGFGAWSGLHTALAHARSEWAFVTACDLPFISRELLRLAAKFVDDEFDAVVPRQQDGRLQPLCSFYRVKPALCLVEATFASGRSLPALAAIVDDLRTRVVGPDEYRHLPNAEKFFFNINTPGELKTASLE